MSVRERLREARAPSAPLDTQLTRNPALEIFLWSRGLLWAGLVFTFLWFNPKPHPNQALWDNTFLHDVGWPIDIWARWDSAWFVRIAQDGYGAHPDAAAFFPLYPGALALVGRLLGGHFVLAGVLVSLAATLGAFLLLYRLAEDRIGAEGARRVVLYLAVFPMTIFLGAVYAESLFLLAALGAFVFAERGRFGAAGVVAGLALLTRPSGAALLPALAILAWRSERPGRAFGGLSLAPLLFLVYPLVLWIDVGKPLAFVDAQGPWHRRLTWLGPLQGIWDGSRAAVAGARQVVAGADAGPYWPIENAEPLHAAAVNLQGFAFLLLFVALAVVVWRRFGAPYGVFATASLLIPLSVPSERWPLLSLPRFGVVVFPFFLALATLGARPRVHNVIVAVSAFLLGIVVVQWVQYQWVA